MPTDDRIFGDEITADMNKALDVIGDQDDNLVWLTANARATFERLHRDEIAAGVEPLSAMPRRQT